MSDPADALNDDTPPVPENTIERGTLMSTLVHLWPYIWPGDRADLKMRVFWSMVLLVIAKLATLTCPSPSNGRSMP